MEFIILLSFASALSQGNSNSEITDQKHKFKEIYINLEPNDYQIIYTLIYIISIALSLRHRRPLCETSKWQGERRDGCIRRLRHMTSNNKTVFKQATLQNL